MKKFYIDVIHEILMSSGLVGNSGIKFIALVIPLVVVSTSVIVMQETES